MSDQPSPAPTSPPSARPFERLASLRLRLSWELALYALFIAVGAGLRFWDLGARAFHHDESLHAQYAFYLFRDGNYEHSAMMHGPFQFFGTAFSFVLFGPATTRPASCPPSWAQHSSACPSCCDAIWATRRR